jgi:hypothetical protein
MKLRRGDARQRAARDRGTDKRDVCLIVLLVLGTTLSLLLWFSSRGTVIPDGAEPEAYGCGGAQDPTVQREATGSMILEGREVGVAAVYYSPRCAAVWGQYTTEVHLDASDPAVSIVVLRSSDGARESVSDLALTDDQNAPEHADWTPLLRFVPNACYSVQVTLTIPGMAPDKADTACESF